MVVEIINYAFGLNIDPICQLYSKHNMSIILIKNSGKCHIWSNVSSLSKVSTYLEQTSKAGITRIPETVYINEQTIFIASCHQLDEEVVF